ncbi:MAG TPA: hypothetical protein DD001_22950 [Microcoleaceae bacterium UBA10368]|nr:hypothetical protein [Microcoleaceae cyanobacterium UBA10368]
MVGAGLARIYIRQNLRISTYSRMLKEEGRRKKEEVIIARVSAIEKVLRRLGGCYKSVILSEAKNLGDSSLRSE